MRTGMAHGGGQAGGAPQGGTCHPRHGSGETAPKGWWGESEGRTPDRGGAAPPVRGAGRPILLPGESTKGVRGAGKGGFAHGRVCGEGPGCKKGWFCSPEGARRVSGVQKGVVLLPGGCEKSVRGAKRCGFAPGRVREECPGSKKGWFCSPEGARRVFGVQKRVVLHTEGSAERVRGAEPLSFAPGRAVKTREEVKKWLKYRGIC